MWDFFILMTFRLNATIDGNSHKGLLALNSITQSNLVITGLSLTNAQPLHVAIVDGSGSQITTFGGGTQYTDGGTPPTHPIGPTLEFNNAGTWATVGSATPLPVNIVSGGGSGGTSSSFGSAFPATGTAIGVSNGTNMVALTLGQQLAASSVPIVLTAAQLITLTPPAAITNYALETGGNLATLAGGVTASVYQNNTKQINGVAPLMGNGVTGTGSQRVTIASDNTAFSVNAVQSTAAALSAGWPVLNGEASDTTGTFTNATQTTSVTASSLDGYGNVLISINGTYGTATAVFEGSDDGGTTWYGISEADRTDSNIIESGYTSLSNTSRAWQISNPGWDSVRVRSTAVASGTINVRISPSAAPTSAGASVSIGVALPTGGNTIGAISNTSFAATQATAANLNATVVGTGTFAVQTTSDTPGTGATNLGKAEDAAHVSSDTGVMSLGVANEALINISGTDGDYTPTGTDRNGTVHVAQKASTATLSNVAASGTSVTLLSANAARIGAQVTNDSSALVYIKFGTTASTTSYTVVLAGAASAPFSYYEVPAGYTGRIDAIWASATGNARVTEITP